VIIVTRGVLGGRPHARVSRPGAFRPDVTGIPATRPGDAILVTCETAEESA
jgi:hypothetical protein